MKKRKQASIAAGAFSGAGTGASIGTAIAPGVGTAVGGALGAIGGGFAGMLAADADAEDPENQEMERQARGMQMFRANMSRAMKARRGGSGSFGEMLNGAA